MIRAGRVLSAAAILLMAGAALAQPGGGKRKAGGMGGYADPSGVIAAEIALGQLSVAKGETAALARMAAKDAILFVPDATFAERALKGQKGPLRSVRWSTEKVYMSCDGTVAVTTGRFAPSDGASGAYAMIWRRDPKAGFRWVLNHRAPETTAPAARNPDDGIEIDAKVAFCKKRPLRPEGQDPKGQDRVPAETRPTLDPRQPAPTTWDDRAEDGSLRWRWAVAPDKSHRLDVWMATERGEAQVVQAAAAPVAP